MKLTAHSLTVDSFVPMLTSLSQWLDKGFAQKGTEIDLVNARLAPDMFTLAQQVQQACRYATDGAARLCGRPAMAMEAAQTTPDGINAQIAHAIDLIGSLAASEFEGAEDRDCSIDIPGDRVIEMDGYRFLTAWSLPHFYFHVVTAYDILRHSGVAIGKFDYLSQVGAFIRPKLA